MCVCVFTRGSQHKVYQLTAILRFRFMECNSMQRLTRFKPLKAPTHIFFCALFKVPRTSQVRSTRACGETEQTTPLMCQKHTLTQKKKNKGATGLSSVCMSQWKHQVFPAPKIQSIKGLHVMNFLLHTSSEYAHSWSVFISRASI